MFDLGGKVALVTGASKGLGFGMALGLAQAGATVILNGRDQTVLDARVAELAAQGLKKAQTACFDVSNETNASAAIADIGQRQGRLDILVNNAGITHREELIKFQTADFQRVLDTNLTAVFAMSREAAKIMIPQKSGRIISTASMSIFMGRPTIPAYIASKGAVAAMTRALAVELGPHGITVNAIAPGYMSTDMTAPLEARPDFDEWVKTRTPVGRWGKPDDLSGPVVFLASDEGAYVNGQVLTVDGGMSIAI
jgi:gluconate 5-dehydrogenase